MIFTPSPVTNCHTFSDPLPPWSVTYFMDGPYCPFTCANVQTAVNIQCLKSICHYNYICLFWQSLAISVNDNTKNATFTESLTCSNRVKVALPRARVGPNSPPSATPLVRCSYEFLQYEIKRHRVIHIRSI